MSVCIFSDASGMWIPENSFLFYILILAALKLLSKIITREHFEMQLTIKISEKIQQCFEVIASVNLF